MKKREIIQKSKTFCLSAIWVIIISILLLEAIGLFVFDNRYYWDLRYLTYTQGAVINQSVKDKALWTYAPNSSVRTIATYADVLGAEVEYDCSFETNSLGFIQAGSEDKPADYLVLGDSFTEGQGGCPWLIKEKIHSDAFMRSYNILNGGLQGAGLQTFEAVLELHEQESIPKNIAIIAISNDFKRGASQVWPLDNLCTSSLTCEKDAYWYFEKFNVTKTELEAQALARRAYRKTSLRREIMRYSFTYRIYQEFYKAIAWYFGPHFDVKTNDMAFAANFAALERMIEKYPEAIILLVPQRDEVGLFGRENSDTSIVKKYLLDQKITFKSCALSSRDYMPIDGHPNARGYAKLFACLKDSIKERENKVSVF